jgi:Dolichyl-phosphate-mannose-protein mannosyltransferase
LIPAGKTSSTFYFAALLLAMAVILTAFWQTTSGNPFGYDESDYMYAGTRGFLSNYLDRPSLSTVDFVREGLRLARDRSQRSNASILIRSAGDITFYRHYHGPTYAYWIALGHALGFDREAQYRASGLVLHALITILMFWLFRAAFPEYPPAAALAAALTFLMNRTALVASTIITQHVMFGLLAALSLFPLAMFCRTGKSGYWYVAVAALGIAFATVETSFILVAAVVLVLCLEGFRNGRKPAVRLFVRGIPVFLLAILVVWPKGVLALGGLKGYMYLGYMALIKKTFTPIGPVALWTFKLRTYPEEFIIPILSLIALSFGWKRLAARYAALPFIVYSWLFICATMIITLPYTYYHDSLMVSCAVVTGVMIGELWRGNAAIRVLAAVVLVASLAAMDVRFYGETVQAKTTHDSRTDLLSYLKTADHSRTVYVPFVLVPSLHFYMPDLNTVGYDESWTPARLASAFSSPGQSVELLCQLSVCRAVESQTKNVRIENSPVMPADAELQQGALYSVTMDKSLAQYKNGPDQLLRR